MGFFDKLFRKKKNTTVTHVNEPDVVTKETQNTAPTFNFVRPLNREMKEAIEKATIALRPTQLYMHYWTDGLILEDFSDPIWQNKVLFFWKAEEPFPKKSLPPEFETFATKYFIFEQNSLQISIQKGKAIPWFGMPGQGEKHICEFNSEKMAIPDLEKLGVVQYIQHIELTSANLNTLTDTDNYYFLVDERITTYKNNCFYANNTPIAISVAYALGGIHLVKKI